MTIHQRKEAFVLRMKQAIQGKEETSDLLNAFYEWATEYDDSKRNAKMRFEMPKNQPFSIIRRLGNFKRNPEWWQDKTKPLNQSSYTYQEVIRIHNDWKDKRTQKDFTVIPGTTDWIIRT